MSGSFCGTYTGPPFTIEQAFMEVFQKMVERDPGLMHRINEDHIIRGEN